MPFDQFVRRHHDALCAYGRARTSGREWESDVGGAFLRAWRSWELLVDEVPEAAHGAWLRRAFDSEVSNRARAERRRAALLERLQFDPTICVNATPDDSTSRSTTGSSIATTGALTSLPRVDRDVLIHHFEHGLSGSVLADALGCSESAARQRLSRALKRLRTALLDVASPRPS